MVKNMKIIKNEKWIELLEGIGVIMRIIAFGTLSIMGPDTPFLWMWIWNSVDAVILTYAAWERNNKSYILLNFFWLIVGIVGIYTSIYGNPFSH
jgi:hypothetical protein